MLLVAFIVTLVTAVIIAIMLLKEVDEIRLELTLRHEDVRILIDEKLDLQAKIIVMEDDLQLESVKAAYAHNQFEKLEEDVLFAQAKLIDTEIKLNKMTAEYLELQHVFAETLVAETVKIQDLVDSLNAQEYVEPFNYQAEE